MRDRVEEKERSRRRCALALAACGLVACGGPDAEPIEGGGGRGGAIAGRVVVFAVDERTGAPIEGARVAVAASEAVTDADGRVALDHDGAADVTVRADGYVTESWLGARAAELTIPLAPADPAPAQAGRIHARLDGVDGFMPGDAANDVRVTLGVSGDLALDGGAPAPMRCAVSDGTCELDVEVPAGAAVVFAQVDEIDPAGQRVAPLALAVSEVVEVSAGGDAEVALAVLEADALRELAVDAPAAPSGIDAVVGVPGLSDGERVIVFDGDGGEAPFFLPDPAARSRTWWAVALGVGPGATSRSVERAETGAAVATLAPPPLRPAPTFEIVDGTIALGEVDAPMVTIEVEGRWRVRRFDDRAVVAPIDGVLDGAGVIRVCATDVALDGGDFRLVEIERGWSRRARASASF